eukprot:4848607-Prorocentrum_lima.AAC.1
MHFYFDGAGGVIVNTPYLRRCGWGFALLLEDKLEFELGCCGSVPGEAQTVGYAELYVLVKLLLVTGGDM